MSSLRSLVDARNVKTIPRMSQPHFIALWRSLHDMLTMQPEDEAMYHAIASIGLYIFLSHSYFFLFCDEVLNYNKYQYRNDL